jgi:Ala-tRNA(Pro) deacylase
MAIGKRLKHYLDSEKIDYDLVSHPRTMTSSESAQMAHISGEQMIKSVVIHHELGYLLAVVPCTHRIDLGTLQNLVGTRLGLASETETSAIFSDCGLGAIPPVGTAYGVDVILDDSLNDVPEVYFEGGDHRTLVHASGEAFQSMMKDARRGRFSHHT